MLQAFVMDQTGHCDCEWLMLQLADSAFPSGGFAHSGGLEAAWQLGAVRDGNTFTSYLDSQMLQTKRAALPFVKSAHAKRQNLKAVDAECNAFLSNVVGRRASIAQGQAFVMAAAKAFGGEALQEMMTSVRRHEIHGHWSPTFGAVTAAVQIDALTASRLFLFISARGLTSAAVRLGIIGPLEAQAIQFGVLKRVRVYTIEEEAAQTSPMLDLWQGMQDRLYSRLFQS